MEITSHQVAQAAGVSRSAVSRAFTRGSPIAEETRARILAAASELGYVPRTLQRASGEALPTVGVVMADITNPFFPEVLEALTLGLRARGFSVQTLCVPRGADVDSVIPDLFRQPLAGVLMGSATISSHLARICRDRGVPVVLLNRAAPSPDISMVGCDNYAGGWQIAELFLRTGRERMAFIGGRSEIQSGTDRERGFRDGLAVSGGDIFSIENGGFVYECAYDAAKRMFAGRKRPDAVFCANDVMAIAALDYVRHELGLNVPADVSVVGFDDIAMAAWRGYRLTTMRQRTDIMIQEAIDLLQRLKSNPESAGISRLVTGVLIERSTTLSFGSKNEASQAGEGA